MIGASRELCIDRQTDRQTDRHTNETVEWSHEPIAQLGHKTSEVM